MEKASTMQLRVGEGTAGGRRGGASGRCVPGVFYWLVSVGWKFRIMYEMFAWTLLTFHPGRNGYREPLFVGSPVHKAADESFSEPYVVLERDILQVLSIFVRFTRC